MHAWVRMHECQYQFVGTQVCKIHHRVLYHGWVKCRLGCLLRYKEIYYSSIYTFTCSYVRCSYVRWLHGKLLLRFLHQQGDWMLSKTLPGCFVDRLNKKAQLRSSTHFGLHKSLDVVYYKCAIHAQYTAVCYYMHYNTIWWTVVLSVTSICPYMHLQVEWKICTMGYIYRLAVFFLSYHSVLPQAELTSCMHAYIDVFTYACYCVVCYSQRWKIY